METFAKYIKIFIESVILIALAIGAIGNIVLMVITGISAEHMLNLIAFLTSLIGFFILWSGKRYDKNSGLCHLCFYIFTGCAFIDLLNEFNWLMFALFIVDVFFVLGLDKIGGSENGNF